MKLGYALTLAAVFVASVLPSLPAEAQTGWPLWNAGCARHFGEGLEGTLDFPTYAPANAPHNSYRMKTFGYVYAHGRHSWLTTPAVPTREIRPTGFERIKDVDGGGGVEWGWSVGRNLIQWKGGVRIDPDQVRFSMSPDIVEESLAYLARGVLTEPITRDSQWVEGTDGFAAILSGKEATAATGGWKFFPVSNNVGWDDDAPAWVWDLDDVYSQQVGKIFPAGTSWSLNLLPIGDVPEGMTLTSSGTGTDAVVTLSGTPTEQAIRGTAVVPYDDNGPLMTDSGFLVRGWCSHNVEAPAWVPGETGGACDYFGVAATGGTRIAPSSSAPSYNHTPEGYAAYLRNVRWSPNPAATAPGVLGGNVRWGMTAANAGWSGNATRQFAAHHNWRLEKTDGTILRGRDAAGRLVPVQAPCVLRVAAPALGGGRCAALTATGDPLAVETASYETYAGRWNAETGWTPTNPPGVTAVRTGGVLALTGSVPDPGHWTLNLRLTDPDGVPLRTRSTDGTWRQVGRDCALRAVNSGGENPPSAASRPAVRIGPSCAPPGDSWETRLRKAGEAGTPKTLWSGFAPPGITDPARLIFWYPYPATLQGRWLAPWEKPLPGPGQTHYEGEFNDTWPPTSSAAHTNPSRYRRLMREAWEEYFPEYPLTP